MARRNEWYLESVTCPECSGYIQASVKSTHRYDNHGWWVVECACGHLFSHHLADGLDSAANATGGKILRVRPGDEFSEEDIEREVTALIKEKEEN